MCTRIGVATLLTISALLPARGLAATPSPNAMLEDFIHYALTAQVEMAKANAEALLKSGLTNEQLAALVDEDPRLRKRLPVAIRWAREVPELETVAGKLEREVERGRMDLARDTDRIVEAIGLLSGTRRARLLAQDRLIEAGEYAVPPMVAVLSDVDAPAEINLGVRTTLPELGREAVLPLARALPHVGASQQVIIINTLADIGYPHAAEAIVTAMQDELASDVVKAAGQRALIRLGWESPEDIALAGLHVQLAQDYLREMEHLRARPTLVPQGDSAPAEMQNIWRWEPQGGLVSELVPTDLYWPVMAVRHAHTARAMAPDDEAALAIFVAGNLRIENRLGDRDMTLPVPALERSPSFHATVHGPAVARDVLLMAIDQDDPDMARDALAALARTGGAFSLVEGGEREAISEALAHPDERVRYDAALVVARAMPEQPFPGSNRVVPLLGSAVRGGDGREAVVVGGTPQDRAAAATRLSAIGYGIAGESDSWSDLIGAGGADVVYMIAGTDDPLRSVEEVVDLGLPVVVVVPDGALTDMRTMTVGLPGVGVLRRGASEQAFQSVVGGLGVGRPLDEADRRFYAAESIAALRELAMSRPAGLDVSESVPPLVKALSDSTGPQQLVVAEVLSVIDAADAQRAIVNAALGSSDEWQQVSLLDMAAASVRRFGDHVSSRQAADLKKFIADARGEVADAAARLYGALNRGHAAAG